MPEFPTFPDGTRFLTEDPGIHYAVFPDLCAWVWNETSGLIEVVRPDETAPDVRSSTEAVFREARGVPLT